MGLAAQLIFWPPAMIQALIEAGYQVVTFDNRDIGLSEKLEHLGAPSPAFTMLTSLVGLGSFVAPYTLRDMARDTVGVLDALEFDDAHLLGVSMGGMIGQVVSARYGDRIRSFTSIMSSTNNRALPRANSEVVRKIIEARTKSRSKDELVNRSVEILRMIGTRDSGRDLEALRQLVATGVDRCSYPAGVRRQIAAIIASGDLRRYAREIRVPTLVLHGDEDPLTNYKGSVDMAENIPGSRLEILEGMGHDLPPRFLDRINDLVVEHLQGADDTRGRTAAA
jgi:pimeloyl-ACP methyl ester carboxylesterase